MLPNPYYLKVSEYSRSPLAAIDWEKAKPISSWEGSITFLIIRIALHNTPLVKKEREDIPSNINISSGFLVRDANPFHGQASTTTYTIYSTSVPSYKCGQLMSDTFSIGLQTDYAVSRKWTKITKEDLSTRFPISEVPLLHGHRIVRLTTDRIRFECVWDRTWNELRMLRTLWKAIFALCT